MATTMNLIAKQTIGSGGAASVTFSNIPQTYTDLKVVYTVRSSNTNPSNTIDLSFNGSTSGFTNIYLQASGTSPSSGSNFARYSGLQNSSSETANTFSNGEIYIPNYTGSNNKSYSADAVYENNSSSGNGLAMIADLWSNTAAITSMTLTGYAGNFVEFSTFYLYGISNSTTTQATTVPYASGGDVITTDGSYWYHTFLYSGTFTPLKNLTCDYLVVAGGGGGGSNGGGGGAGGLRSTVTATGGGGSLETPLALLANTYYTATVGAGGAGGGSGTYDSGSNGNNSVFATITSTAGGGASGADGLNGKTGGSGGGGGWGAGIRTGGAGTTNQGYAGGTSTSNVGGGGGGAGAVGASAGTGGNGVATSISGSSITYAGGGGGGDYNTGPYAGGTGGGGSGGTGSGAAGVNGTANRGAGGGGGGSNGGSGGTGGSGIIVVRYAV